MKYPKIKNALLCRILVYVIIISIFVIPAIVVSCLSFIPTIVRAVSVFLFLIAFLIYIIKYYAVLMAIDILLASLHCRNTARTQYPLPDTFSENKLISSVQKFGISCSPHSAYCKPLCLVYKFSNPITVYTSGIEKIIALYSVNELDKQNYSEIIESAKANSIVLKGKQTARHLDKQQKESPINQVTVVYIITDSIDENLRKVLFDTLVTQDKDGYNISIIPCIINRSNKTCIFNSIRLEYIGYQYPVRNRGIRIIKKQLFNNKPNTKNNTNLLPPIKDFNTEQSLWELFDFCTSKNEPPK